MNTVFFKNMRNIQPKNNKKKVLDYKINFTKYPRI